MKHLDIEQYLSSWTQSSQASFQGRVKLIPFNRHFTEQEQDNGLKMLFRKRENVSGILNWLLEGYLMLNAKGLTAPNKIRDTIKEYKQEADVTGAFCR